MSSHSVRQGRESFTSMHSSCSVDQSLRDRSSNEDGLVPVIRESDILSKDRLKTPSGVKWLVRPTKEFLETICVPIRTGMFFFLAEKRSDITSPLCYRVRAWYIDACYQKSVLLELYELGTSSSVHREWPPSVFLLSVPQEAVQFGDESRARDSGRSTRVTSPGLYRGRVRLHRSRILSLFLSLVDPRNIVCI